MLFRSPTIAVDTAGVGAKVRIRAPWAPLVRAVEPPATAEIGGKILSWSDPGVAWLAPVGASTPNLYVRDWNGDAIDDLLLGANPGAAGLSLRLMKLSEGALSTASTVARTFAIAGWRLR